MNPVQNVIDVITKQFGRGAIMRLAGGPAAATPVNSTGFFELDEALGVGGLPPGCVVEILGTATAGKATLSLHMIAAAQRQGRVCAFIDTEHDLNPAFAQGLGVRLDCMLVAQPGACDQALEIAEALARSGAVDLVVIGPLSALAASAELDTLGEEGTDLAARRMCQSLRRLIAVAAQKGTTVVFLTHRLLAGADPAVLLGNALKFYAAVRLDLRRTGARARIKVVKNKLAPPFREAELHLPGRAGTGIG